MLGWLVIFAACLLGWFALSLVGVAWLGLDCRDRTRYGVLCFAHGVLFAYAIIYS